MSATKFSFVTKLFGQMKEMSIKEINGGRENIRRKTNCTPPALCRRGRDGFLPPSTANQLLYFKFMNEKFRERKSSPVFIQKQRKAEMVAYMEQTH